MKKIINGRRYDTETAKELGFWDNNFGVSDFNFVQETLYQKRTGEYFLHGEGGPMTKYAETIGMNQWSGGERIMPMSYEEAREWAESHLEADDYEKIFGQVSEGEKIITTFSISEDAKEKLRKLAQEENMSMSEYIEKLIREA